MVLLLRPDLFIGLSLSSFSSYSSKGYFENSMQGTRSFPNLFPASSWGSLQSSFLGAPLFSLCLLFWMISICINTQTQLTSSCWGLAHPCFVCTCSSKFLTRSSWDWQKDPGRLDDASPIWLKRKLLLFSFPWYPSSKWFLYHWGHYDILPVWWTNSLWITKCRFVSVASPRPATSTSSRFIICNTSMIKHFLYFQILKNCLALLSVTASILLSFGLA